MIYRKGVNNLPYYYYFLKMTDKLDTIKFTNNEEENY